MNRMTRPATTTILLVDDSVDQRLLLERSLRAAGYQQVLSAESPLEAFQHLGMEDPTTPAPTIDLILMDIVMPGMNGIEACRRIKAVARLRDIPVVMVTVRNETTALAEAFEAGAVDYITKPVEQVELLVRIRSMLTLKHEMDARKTREQELRARNRELAQALQEVKRLRGFIPICAWCKKVRIDLGYWQQVETYIQERSEATFSHSICPDCVKTQTGGG